jgi:hypothetical protein
MVAVITGAGMLSGCGVEDVVLERSFTDQHGRACAYVLVNDKAEEDDTVGDLDAWNIDCDFPPSPQAVGTERP